MQLSNVRINEYVDMLADRQEAEDVLKRRRNILYAARDEHFIDEPKKVLKQGFLNYFRKVHDFYCPKCEGKLGKVVYKEMFILETYVYSHLTCHHCNDYEVVVGGR